MKEIINEKLYELREIYPNYKIILTGHSLGAACAALYAMMLLEENNYKIDLHAYCFGCPSLVTLDLALKFKKYITTVVHNFDIVPRLSYGSLEDLKLKIVNVLDQSGGFFGTTFQSNFYFLF